MLYHGIRCFAPLFFQPSALKLQLTPPCSLPSALPCTLASRLPADLPCPPCSPHALPAHSPCPPSLTTCPLPSLLTCPLPSLLTCPAQFDQPLALPPSPLRTLAGQQAQGGLIGCLANRSRTKDSMSQVCMRASLAFKCLVCRS
jgi:hypothetical protein